MKKFLIIALSSLFLILGTQQINHALPFEVENVVVSASANPTENITIGTAYEKLGGDNFKFFYMINIVNSDFIDKKVTFEFMKGDQIVGTITEKMIRDIKAKNKATLKQIYWFPGKRVEIDGIKIDGIYYQLEFIRPIGF